MGYTVLLSHKAEKYLKSLQSEIARHIKEEVLTLENASNPKTLLKKIESQQEAPALFLSCGRISGNPHHFEGQIRDCGY